MVSPTYFGPDGRQLPSATAAVATAARKQLDIAQAARWLSALLDRDCEPHEGSRGFVVELSVRAPPGFRRSMWEEGPRARRRSWLSRVGGCRWVTYGISGAAAYGILTPRSRSRYGLP